MNRERYRTPGDGAKQPTIYTSPRPREKANSLSRTITPLTSHVHPNLSLENPSTLNEKPIIGLETSTPPAKGLANLNVTPRSGARRARVESASPTSNDNDGANRTLKSQYHARNRSRADINLPGDSRAGSPLDRMGKSISNPIIDATESSRASGLNSTGRISPADQQTQLISPTMFFHADDVQENRSSKSQMQPVLPTLGRLPNHNNVGEEPDPLVGSPSVSLMQSLEDRTKFFRADDLSEVRTPPAQHFYDSVSSKPALQSSFHAHPVSSPPRAPSPLKEEIRHREPSSDQVNSAGHTRYVSTSGSHIPRRSSTNASAQSAPIGRRKSDSIRSNTQASRHSDTARLNSNANEPSRLTASDGLNSEHFSTLDQFTTPTQKPNGPLSPQFPQSPTKSQSRLDQANELAANARRERKVLDLEISNSSLLAINRTLEREMRRQTAELRRLRRLTRFNLVSGASSRSASRKLSIASQSKAEVELDDFQSDSESDKEKADDSQSARSSTLATSLCSSPTDRNASSRFQDPKYLPLDLTVQRNLLVENHKFNQSIIRCLNHTDSLLTLGRDALARQSSISEPEHLGPKVLAPEDLESDTTLNHRKGLLSPSLPQKHEDNTWEQSLNQTIDAEHKSMLLDAFVPNESSSDVELEDSGDDTVHLKAVFEKSTKLENANLPEEMNDEDSKAPSPTLIPLPGPGLSDEPEDFEPSLDGLDSDLESTTPTPPPKSDLLPAPRIGTPPAREQGPSHSRQASSPSRNIGAAANAPGNRSSMQTLGQIFGMQSFSIFGLSGGKDLGGT